MTFFHWGISSYVISLLVIAHQRLKGYAFDVTQIGGVHHETLYVIFGLLSMFCFFASIIINEKIS